MAVTSDPPSPASSAPPHLDRGSLRRAVAPFALWDGGMSALSSVSLTFVFATYVASALASEGAVGGEAVKAAQDHGSQVLTTWQSIGAVAVALLAPLLGNLADRGGARNALLRITTIARSEEHTSELQSRGHLVCRLLLEKKKKLLVYKAVNSRYVMY